MIVKIDCGRSGRMAKEDNINKILELQKELKEEHREYISKYLSNAPYWVLESMQVIHKPKRTVFIEENEPADNVYFLLDGMVRAIDYRIQGVAYDYMWFDPVNVFGAMEIFFHMPLYMTTLMTLTPCTMLVISKANYEKWIWDDKNALRMEINTMGNYLLEQNRIGRVYLFLQGIDRIMYLLVKNYEQEAQNDELIFDVTRQELAERSGFSIKTVNRAIKKIQEDKYISRMGRKILINREQYEQMKKYLDDIVKM